LSFSLNNFAAGKLEMQTHITLLTWPDYINPLTLQQFGTEFGIKIELEIVPSAVELIERMRASAPSPDVLCPPDYAVRELNAERCLAVLDHSQLPNLDHLDPRFLKGRAHDSESRVSIIKDWGTTGFIYRTDMIHETPGSWADFWRLACSAKFSGRVTVLDSPGEVIGAALKMRGHSYNATDAEELTDVREDLLLLKPHLLAFETNYRPLIAAGEACLSLGWNGDAAALKAQGVPVQYVIPSEGSQIWEDDWAIAAKSSNPLEAHLFLDFVMQPEVAAQEARYTRYATGNRDALALLDEEIRQDKSTYPPQELLAKLESGMPLDDEGQKRREKLWREVRGLD
jgi:spermidine/putrescine transport system substrate-binding protein